MASMAGSPSPTKVSLRPIVDVAAELGTVSETLSRTLAGFRTRKLIRVEGKTVSVLDPHSLDRILRKNLGEL